MRRHTASKDTPGAAQGRRKAPIASKSVRYDVRPPILFSPPSHGLVAMRYSSEAIDMQYISGIVREADSRSMIQISNIHLMLNRLSSCGRPAFHYRKEAA